MTRNTQARQLVNGQNFEYSTDVAALLQKACHDADEVNWLLSRLDELGFNKAPASAKYHLNYPGGLREHSIHVATVLEALTKDMCLFWQNPRSPYIVGLMHDLCKCDQYTEVHGRFEYEKDTMLKGHGEKSVMIASTLLQLTEEEVLCIRYHMGAFVPQEEWNDYTRAIHKYPNVLYTHMADMIATHILEER